MKCIFEANTICRLCLRVDEKVLRLDNADHKAFIESIIKIKQIHYVPPDDLYVCYICHALITKSFNFVQTLWNTQNVICGMLKNVDIITKPMLLSINRNNNGLNPITLTSVVICGNKFKYEGCSDGNTSSDIEEVDFNLLDIKAKNYKEKSKQKQECKKKQNVKHLSASSSSDESVGLDKCNLDEVEVEISNIPKEDIQVESCDPLTKNVIVIEDESDEEKVTKKKVFKKKRPCPPKPKDAKKVIKRKKKDDDVDYKPDSTSHSEDSDHDLYDDEGRRIIVPKRVYPMKCAHCDFIIEKGLNHYRHYQYEHPQFEYPYKKNRIYACSVCGKLFAKGDINTHEANHITLNLKCNFCPKVFSNRIKRYSHMTTVHTKRLYTCDYCSKTFKTRIDITRHFRIHTGSKPYKCHICGDDFAHSGNRTIHIRSKHQNYRYISKKQEKNKKKRRSNKRNSTDTEMTEKEETKQRTKTKKIRKNKNQSGSADVQSKRVYSSDSAMASEMDRKIIRGKRTSKRSTIVQNITHNDTDVNIDQQNKNYENAGIDSDDEVLAVIKTKKH